MKKLEEISKQNPFRVPDNYFDEVSNKIVARTAGTDTGSVKIITIRRIRPYLMAAAAIAAIVLFGYICSQLFKTPGNLKGLPGLSLVEYSDSHVNDIDILTLEENVSKKWPLREENGFNNNDIIDYLVLDDIDVNDIYEQL